VVYTKDAPGFFEYRGAWLEILMKLNSLMTVALAAAVSAASAFAATPAIGVASALGSFSVNSAQVSGNANVFDGSQVRTDKAASQILLQNGSSLTLATNTAATVYNDHLVIREGAARVDDMSNYSVQGLGYRVVADEPGSQTAVRLDNGAFEVASMSGAVKVFDSKGAMLTRIGAGTASSFKPGQTGASGASGASGGAASTIGSGSSTVLLYGAVVLGLAGAGLGTLAYVKASDNASSPVSH
jgi:ferric-dicitrate binding protein FerR (iron transport regulator)